MTNSFDCDDFESVANVPTSCSDVISCRATRASTLMLPGLLSNLKSKGRGRQLRISHGVGSFGRTLQQLAKVDVLNLDD